MRIGLIGFQEACNAEIARKCISTLSHSVPSGTWRFGQVCSDLNNSDAIEREIARRTSIVARSGDTILSISAAPQDIDSLLLVQFEIYSQRTCSAIRIRLDIPGTLVDRVQRCQRLMMGLVPVWNPDSAYVTDFDEMQRNCAELSGVFPSGYMIYRKRQHRLQLDSRDSDVFQATDCETGVCVGFRERFLATSRPTCEQFKELIERSGGVDDRFSVL